MRLNAIYSFVCCLVCGAHADGQTLQCNGAYDRDRLLRMVATVGKLTSSQSRALALVERCGVGVAWSEDLSTALRNAGAGTPLHDRIREASGHGASTSLTIRDNPKDGLAYVWIPPGEFFMGCSDGDGRCDEDEKPKHKVRLTRGFWLGRTEVTQEAWVKTGRVNPSHFRGPALPVEQVSWSDASAHCQSIDGRMPTEAEWEYAARAGSSASRYGEIDQTAWYSANSGGRTHPVATKLTNRWGLYDMLGNVLEWVADRYDNAYYGSRGEFVDPRGPDRGRFQVLRGGSWSSGPIDLRVSGRAANDPSVWIVVVGFRCVWDAPAP